jgi:CBS domain-containing protein
MRVQEVVKNHFRSYAFNYDFDGPYIILNAKKIGRVLISTGIHENHQDESGFKRFNTYLRKWVSIRPPIFDREEISPSRSVVGDVYDKIVDRPTFVKKGAKLKEAMEMAIQNPLARSVYVIDDDNRVLGAIDSKTLLRFASFRAGVKDEGGSLYFGMGRAMDEEVTDRVYFRVWPVTKKTDLKKALYYMINSDQDSLPVVDEEGKLLGELIGHELLMKCKTLYA